MAQIELTGVSKSYETETAVAGIDLTFKDRVTTALVGASGSGKSTLLQMVNGLVRPDTGSVRLFGRPLDYENLAPLRRRIGYAVQETGLFPHLTVEKNITLLARLENWDNDRMRDRMVELMRLVELPKEYALRYPYELSGGQKQRVGLCRAMMLNPPVFLLDEPFGALDPITRREVHREFLRLQASEPRTMVLVTHDVIEAIALAEEIVVLREGRVEQHGTSEQVVREPASDFVAELFRTESP